MAHALVIIDVQQGMFSIPDMQPYQGVAIVARIGALIAAARNAAVPVIFIQHDGGPGHPLDSQGSGFAYHPDLRPCADDIVITKHQCNAFQGTDLAGRLRALTIDAITVCGMQTQYCVDTCVRSAVEHGFTVRLVADGHTTFGTSVLSADQIVAHHNDVLGGGFASLAAAAEVDFSADAAAG